MYLITCESPCNSVHTAGQNAGGGGGGGAPRGYLSSGGRARAQQVQSQAQSNVGQQGSGR